MMSEIRLLRKEFEMATKKKTVKKYRRADTGRYTTEDYAKKHPNTTVRETDKVTKRKPKKKK
jgi:hypothetical protein